MKPGKEMDQLIAERVLGRKAMLMPGGGLHFMDIPVPKTPDGRVMASPYTFVPHYSRDIAAAWEVVEKLAPDGFVLYRSWDVKSKPVWVVAQDCQDTLASELARHESAPAAICLAALKAVGAL